LTDLRAQVRVIRDGSIVHTPATPDAVYDVAVTDTLEWVTSPTASGVGMLVRVEVSGSAFEIADSASRSVNVGALLRELGLAAPCRCRLHLDWIRRSEQATATEFTLNVRVVAGTVQLAFPATLTPAIDCCPTVTRYGLVCRASPVAAPEVVLQGVSGAASPTLKDKAAIVALSSDVLRWECEQSDCSIACTVGRPGGPGRVNARLDQTGTRVVMDVCDALRMASLRVGDTIEVSAWSLWGTLKSPSRSLIVTVAGTPVVQ
jgi:hypothetical protein